VWEQDGQDVGMCMDAVEPGEESTIQQQGSPGRRVGRWSKDAGLQTQVVPVLYRTVRYGLRIVVSSLQRQAHALLM
jgi:hypothetical protein